jgi:hypothetical protein
LTPGRTVEQAGEQGSKIEARPTDHQRQVPPLFDASQDFSALIHVLAGCELPVRIEKIDQVVGDAVLFVLENL